MEETKFHRIEAYLLAQMPEADRLAFEQELAENESLQNELVEQRQLMQLIEFEGARAVLQEVMSEQAVEEAPVRSIRWRRIAPLAAIAAVALVLILINLFRPTPSPERMFEQYFTPAQGLPTLLGEVENQAFIEGMIAYKRGEYVEAIQYWEPIIVSYNRDTLGFYNGLANLAIGNNQEAEKWLSDNTISPLQEQRRWYLALALLRQEKLAEVRTLLASFPPTHPYATEAGEILAQLEKMEQD